MCRFSLNIRKKISSVICALAGLEAYTEQLELQKFCQDFRVILYLAVWLDKINYNLYCQAVAIAIVLPSNFHNFSNKLSCCAELSTATIISPSIHLEKLNKFQPRYQVLINMNPDRRPVLSVFRRICSWFGTSALKKLISISLQNECHPGAVQALVNI